VALQVGSHCGLRQLGGTGDELAERNGVTGQVLLRGSYLGLAIARHAERVVHEVADVGAPEGQELLLSGGTVLAADGGAERIGVLAERGQGCLGTG
jgi:hypothetical protein